MTKQKKVLVYLAIFLVIMAIWFSLSCPPLGKCPFFKTQAKAAKKVTLVFVGPWDTSDDWGEIIEKFNKYKKKPTNGYLDVSIKYQKVDTLNYQDILENKQFNDSDPNIYMIFNAWVPKYKDKIAPMPPEIMTVEEFNNTFAKVTRDDLVSKDGKIYGLPMYVDTLALYYNEDMFFNANIAKPPETWDEFKADVEKLTIRDKDGNFIQMGAAFGGGTNVNRSMDILMVLVMQNNNAAKFKDLVTLSTLNATAAVKYYTDFTDPTKAFYTWNDMQMYSIDAFVQKKAAMMINYSHHIENINDKTGDTLNFKIAPLPQVDINNKVNYANYWVPVVSKKATCKKDKELAKLNCSQLAWEFLDFAAKKENVKYYLKDVSRPPADLATAKEQLLKNDAMSVFAGQVFTAKSWDHPDDAATDAYIEEMINSITTSDSRNKKSLNGAITILKKRIKVLN